MKELSCQDLGARCKYTARGNNADEVKRKLWAHATEKHQGMMSKMTPETERTVGVRMDRLMRTA